MTRRIVNRTLVDDQEKANYIFVSDIHGNAATLTLIDKAKHDFPQAQLVCGGDYVDGRSHVKEVLAYLHQQKKQGAIVLRGNHEQMLLNFAVHREHEEGIWFYNGGGKTLKNLFGQVVSADELHQSKYYAFLESCPIMYETPHIIFVHAGVRPDEQYNVPSTYTGVELGLKFDYDFYRVWARAEYWYSHGEVIAHNRTGKTIVSGHTPTASLAGAFDDGRVMNNLSFRKCIVRKMQYSGEPARIFADGGCHSNALIYPHNDGNVVVLDSQGQIVRIYSHAHPEGTDFDHQG